MLEVSGSRPDRVQEKKEKKCARSLGDIEKKKERRTELEEEENRRKHSAQ